MESIESGCGAFYGSCRPIVRLSGRNLMAPDKKYPLLVSKASHGGVGLGMITENPLSSIKISLNARYG